MKRLAIVALAIMLAGCTNNDLSGPAGGVDATFSLRSINGMPLPVTFTDGSTVDTDVLSLFFDGTYSDAAQFRDGTLFVEQGYYDDTNGSFTFQERTTGAVYRGSLTGSTLTEIVNGATKVYEQN